MNEEQRELKEIAFSLAILIKKENESLEKTIINATKILAWLSK